MAPLPPPSERTLQAVGARRRTPGEPTRNELVDRLRRLNAEAAELVAVFDADAIGGERHLLSAWGHLGRSRARGEARLRNRSAEYALFVAGDDQLPRALAKVGVRDDTERFVVVWEKPRRADELLATLGFVEDPTAYPRPPTESTLARFGILPEERSTIPLDQWEGLILERVALVDLSAARSGEKPSKRV